MKLKLLTSIIAGSASLGIATDQAHSAFVRLTTIWVLPSGSSPPFDILRIYATFDNPNDRVNAWFGSPQSPLDIWSVLGDNITPAANFLQVGGVDGQLAPPYGGDNQELDTYATIGVRLGDQAPGGIDATTLTPGFPTFITGNAFTTTSGMVSVDPSAPQGLAGYVADDEGPDNSVMLMQLTVSQGVGFVRGRLNLAGAFADGTPYVLNGLQFYNSIAHPPAAFPPSPSTLMALLIAGGGGASGRRRQRTSD